MATEVKWVEREQDDCGDLMCEMNPVQFNENGAMGVSIPHKQCKHMPKKWALLWAFGGMRGGGCWQIFVVLPCFWQWRLWHHRWTVAHLPCYMSLVNFILGGVSLLYKLTPTLFSLYCATGNKGVLTKTQTHTHEPCFGCGHTLSLFHNHLPSYTTVITPC